MSPWQRRARLIIAVAGTAFAIALAFAFRSRAPRTASPIVERSDPAAVVETAAGRTFRINRDREEVRIDYEKLLTYSDGATRLHGVTVTTERDGGRVFVMKGDNGQVGEKESHVSLDGHVELTANDGLMVKTDRATYADSDGVVRAPGPVQFSRGRMRGSAVGLTYDKNQDVVVLLDQVQIELGPGDGGAMQITSGTAEFRRPERVVRFDRALHAVRDARTMAADSGVARLDEDGSTLQAIELRGNARIADVPDQPGSLESMTSHDMDLRYGPDGQTLEQARLTGDAVVQVAGQAGQNGRRISSRTIDITLAGGATPTGLQAREAVQLLIPAESDGGAIRTIHAQTLDASGDAAQGIKAAHFAGDVQFRERGPAVNRAARSGVLDVTLAPGFGAIQEARFSRAVRFEESSMAADAAAARYALDKGTLALSGREPGRDRPHVVHDRMGVYATTIDIVLEGPDLTAAGDVKSVLQPARDGDGARSRTPSMLKRDQIVNITAAELRYDGKASTAVYNGNALLWQGETSIKAATISIDDTTGNMAATGPVATSVVLDQTDDKGKKERTRSTTTAKGFAYVEADRKATYTGDAHMNSAQGDLTAARIELFLKPSGDELERAEAYDAVTLREQSRKTTGTRMTYFGADERYVITGAPVTILDECGRETTGRTLTFFRTADRIVIDGSEQIRTQTRGGSQCSGS
jgi:LPS export ABC transporter protein LptC/lipopolysaccharide transport protein LptA